MCQKYSCFCVFRMKTAVFVFSMCKACYNMTVDSVQACACFVRPVRCQDCIEMEGKMAGKDWNNLGQDLNRIIEDAIHMGNFGRLNQNINDALRRALQMDGNELRM